MKKTNKTAGRAGFLVSFLSLPLLYCAPAPEATSSIRVACVQMAVKPDIDRNLREILRWIEKAAAEHARVVVFPECALTGFDHDYFLTLTWEKIAKGQRAIAHAARKKNLYVIYGAITDSGKKRPYNTAIVVGPDGREIHHYHKMLPEGWFEPGPRPSLFEIDGVKCTMIICHDQRYPELVRIPVLAGARICFSPAFEVNSLRACLQKADGYRCQVVARAEETSIWFVESNAYGPSGKNPGVLSLGDSRIIDPVGIVVAEARPLSDWLGVYDLDIRRATRGNALRSLGDSALSAWWREAVERLKAETSR